MKYSEIVKDSTPRLEIRYNEGDNGEHNWLTTILPNVNSIPKRCLLGAVIKAQVRLCTPLASFPNNDFLCVAELPDKVTVIAFPSLERLGHHKIKNHKELFYASPDIPVDGLLTLLEFVKQGLMNGILAEMQAQKQSQITQVNRFGQIVN